ncbi:MAG: HTTM domain-containing protein [Polyangiaceae bacterium]
MLICDDEMRQWGRWFLATYMTVDPRSLGVFRVLFGLVLLSDLARRWVELGFWYVNSGLLPNHTLLWRPPTSTLFSLFFTVSSAREAQFGFLLCAIVYAMFTLGYRTRWAQAFALLARVSLNSRLAVLENGGDMVMDLLCLLTLPLPLGTRFSLDALASPRETPEPAGEAGESSASKNAPVVSIAVLALILQFSAIYLFNASSKSGPAWQDGSAVFYALHQDKLVTWLGVWMREHLSISTLRLLTWSTLGTEWLGFSLIISPLLVREARLLAVCIMPALHLGFALGLNLGGFSPAMMSFFPLLLMAEHWEWLSKRFGARLRPISEALESRLRPLLRPRLPARAAANPINRWLGEGAIALVLVAIASEALNDNAAVPQSLRVHQPKWAKAIIEYPRILQGWRMFASEPSRVDSMIYVDAITAAGVHVDPYNAVASDQREPGGTVVPTHMGQSQFFFMYSERIPYDGYAAYRQAFSEWLLAYPERTGHAEDCLLSYDVYLVTDRSPEPGTHAQPTPLDHQRFMNYSAPFDSPCRLGPAKKAASVKSASEDR